MGLESHSRSILRSELSKEYLKRITYLTSDSRIDFQTNLEESLKSIYGPESKFNFLVAEKEKLRNTIELNKFPERIEEWELSINKIMDSKLSEIDLSQFEMSNQVNIDLFLSIIEKANEYIDDAKLYLKRILKTDRNEWDDLIHEIGKKSKINSLFWDDFDSHFVYDSLNRSDQSNLKLIYTLGKDFYKNLNSKLYLVNNINKASENNKLVEESLSTVLQSFITKEKDLLNTTIRIKGWYDDNLEDISYKLLLQRIMENDATMEQNMPYELLTKLSIIDDKIKDHSFETNNEEFQTDPSVNNLVLHYRITDELAARIDHCRVILQGHFISETDPEIFKGLFIEGGFICKVNWIRGNKELHHFINGIKDCLMPGDRFQFAANCFLNKGKPAKRNSIASDGSKPDARLIGKEKLNSAIKLFTEYKA